MRHVQNPPREKYDRGGIRKQASDYQGLLDRRENNDSGNKEEIGDMILSESPRIEFLLGDCMDYMKGLPDKVFELAIVDF